ncbi:conserved hypothetical protein [Leishmania braziliensis MHOM/BR/75/M2904]|uniref:Uncharacterized protein n=2 Tax=Leishmania braziliensis TaxID=5660 RepID=A4HN91_LEIBR|nr:conserved hypothetical protein [Leishmania braziliensis MHOM/BR/75/M2904]KAI5689490.1 hypothetical protein MNV84_07655 [Leishmania braziliensis]CAJ2480719.1 unnamed protein product [Leishmania braziliensis]CAJ2481042.1 unnamed protein product [Leishmania braziliensis]CAM43636.1 conserved hypothetical protein [Leishmania braziliensis MHOM/BR/75/M2904]SYZ69691.1 hypothetical_protein [Leishmania braziliensis MHOM/BR/75/M2904]
MPLSSTAPQPLTKEEETLATPSASLPQAHSTETPETTPTASSSPKMTAASSKGEVSANDSGTPTAATAPRETRFLRDAKIEEDRYIYETLYKSLDDTTDTAIRDELTVGDTVRFARNAKREFSKATGMPLGEKAKSCTALVRSFSQKKNQKVAYVFILFSVLIMTLPVIVLFMGMKLVAPWIDMDPTLCGGGLAVFTAMSLMFSYVVFAIMEDAQCGRQNASEAESKKER